MSSRVSKMARITGTLLLMVIGTVSMAQDLTVGSGSAPAGGSVAIPIDFVNGGSLPVVAMNFDILYDPVDIEGVDVASNCDGNLLSPGEVICTNPAPGIVRIIVFSLDLLALESTELGTVTFDVDPNTTASSILLSIDTDPQTFAMSDEFGFSVPPNLLLGGEITVTGAVGFLEASPTLIDFGPVDVTDPAVCQVVSAVNSGTDDLVIEEVFLGGLPFFTQNDTCLGNLLAPLDSCSIDVCFDPDSTGIATDTLTILSDVNSVAIDLEGEGVASVDDSNLVVTPPSVDFGPLEVDAQGVCTVLEATNTGQESSLVVGTVNLVSGLPFSRVATTCPGAELLPGEVCSVTLCFNAAEEGVFSDDLVVTSSANDVVVPVSGEGVVPPEFGLSISPMSFDFGPNEPDQLPVCTDFIVTNENSELAVDVSDVALETGEAFTLGNSDCPDSTLAPGQSCGLEVCFDSDVAGSASDRLIVNGSDVEPVSAEASVSGELQIPPELAVVPDNIDLGLHFQGFSNPSALVDVRNAALPGAPDLILDRVELSDESPFQLFPGTCETGTALVAGGEGCTVTVVLSTAEIGVFEGELLVTSLEGLGASASLRGEVRALDAGALDDRIVFRGPGTADALGVALDTVRDFTSGGTTELMIGAPGDGAVYLVSDILLGLGAFADEPALLADIAMADGSAGVRLEPESGQLSACFRFGFDFGFSVAAISGATGPTAADFDGAPIIAIGNPNWGGPGDLDEFDTRGVAYVLKGSRAIGQGTISVSDWLADDPELASAGLRLVRRASEGPCIGAGLAGLGDIDGDGFPDLAVQDSAITIPGDTGVQTTYIVHGAPDLFELDEIDVENAPDRVTRIVVPFNEGGFFTNLATVSAAGDFNDDGFADFVVTAPNARFLNMGSESVHAGAAFVILGSAERLPAEVIIPQMIDETTFGEDVRVIFGPEVAVDGEETVIGIDVPRFGAAVDAAGDLNGDGIDDLVIGAGQAENEPGAVFIVHGSDATAPIQVDGMDESAGRMLPPVASDDGFFGEAVRGVGDVSGDRVNDLLIGAPFSAAIGSDDDEAMGTGRAYVISGAALGEPSPGEDIGSGAHRIDLDESLPASVLNDVRFGFALAGFGTDVTADFGNDVAIAAFRGAATDGGPTGGWVFVTAGEAPPPPRIDAVAPEVGTVQGGTTLTIEGADFAEGVMVDFINGEQATSCIEVERVDASLLTCVTPPAGVGPVDVRVTNPEGQKDTLEAGFTFIEVTSLSVEVGEFPDDFGLDGRLVQIDTTNEGDFSATELRLTVELTDSGQNFESALNLLVDCGVTDDGVRCSSAAEPRWSCSIDGSTAQCSQASLEPATVSRLLLLVGGEGVVPVEVSVDAFNAAAADRSAELFE